MHDRVRGSRTNVLFKQVGQGHLQNSGNFLQRVQCDGGKPTLKLGQETDGKSGLLAQLFERHFVFSTPLLYFGANSGVDIHFRFFLSKNSP